MTVPSKKNDGAAGHLSDHQAIVDELVEAEAIGQEVIAARNGSASLLAAVQAAASTGGGGSGVTDHGALTGLSDDDHAQYLTNARGDARYYTKSQADSAVAAIAGEPAGLTGAGEATRYVGATTSGAPTTGSFAAGDFVVSKSDATIFICTTSGSPGTWVQLSGGGGAASSLFYDAGTAAPSNAAGSNGQYALWVSNGSIYIDGPKAAGAWPQVPSGLTQSTPAMATDFDFLSLSPKVGVASMSNPTVYGFMKPQAANIYPGGAGDTLFTTVSGSWAQFGNYMYAADRASHRYAYFTLPKRDGVWKLHPPSYVSAEAQIAVLPSAADDAAWGANKPLAGVMLGIGGYGICVGITSTGKFVASQLQFSSNSGLAIYSSASGIALANDVVKAERRGDEIRCVLLRWTGNGYLAKIDEVSLYADNTSTEGARAMNPGIMALKTADARFASAVIIA